MHCSIVPSLLSYSLWQTVTPVIILIGYRTTKRRERCSKISYDTLIMILCHDPPDPPDHFVRKTWQRSLCLSLPRSCACSPTRPSGRRDICRLKTPHAVRCTSHYEYSKCILPCVLSVYCSHRGAICNYNNV